MKRILNPKTIKKALEKRQAAEIEAKAKALLLTEDEKDNIQATVLRELTLVCTNRIKLLEEVLGRKVSISTSVPMEVETETGSKADNRTFKIIVE